MSTHHIQSMRKQFYKAFMVLSVSLSITACVSVSNQQNVAKEQDWPSYGRDYTNQRFSPLTQINPQNVKNLTLAWHFKSGVSASFQATPIVVGGIMYVALPYNHVVALDAKTGQTLWRYQHAVSYTHLDVYKRQGLQSRLNHQWHGLAIVR